MEEPAQCAIFDPPIQGCRAIPWMPNMKLIRVDKLSDCAAAAYANGFPGFAIEVGWACFGSADMLQTYSKYGPSTSCTNGDIIVYRLKKPTCKYRQICALNCTCRRTGNVALQSL